MKRLYQQILDHLKEIEQDEARKRISQYGTKTPIGYEYKIEDYIPHIISGHNDNRSQDITVDKITIEESNNIWIYGTDRETNVYISIWQIIYIPEN